MTKDLERLRAEIDAHLDGLLEQFYASMPSARHLADAKSVNPGYYKRYTVEIILRLRMKRWIDALTIHYFTKHDPVLAKKWAHYTEDEMLHDSLFMLDLERLGMTRDEVYSTQPLFSTKILQGYFYYGLEHEGRPLASLCSSYFIEYMSTRTQRDWLQNVQQSLGAESARGSLAHVQHDENDNHVDFVWDVIATFIRDPKDEAAVRDHLDNVYRLFYMFFEELAAVTLATPESASTSNALPEMSEAAA